MRTSPRWIHWHHRFFQVAIHLQLSYHDTLGFSKHVVHVLIITPSYDIETGWSQTRWKGDNDAVILDLVPAPDPSWINRYVHDKVLRHLFWANLVMYRIRALSPCCRRLPLVASNTRSFLLYISRRRYCLDLGFVFCLVFHRETESFIVTVVTNPFTVIQGLRSWSPPLCRLDL